LGESHTQQRFHLIAHNGELEVDQARRGYLMRGQAGHGGVVSGGYASLNPLYMRYTPNAASEFVGQQGYGFVSLATFVQAAIDVNNGKSLENIIGK
jgi:D-galacturonate reductase